MAYYLCYPKYCEDRNNTLDKKNEIISAEINDNFVSKCKHPKQSLKDKGFKQNNQSMSQSIKKNNIGDPIEKSKILNPNSNCFTNYIKDNNQIHNNMNASMTNIKSGFIALSSNDHPQLYQAENHIVKRINKKDYDDNIVYGKPSHIYSTVMKNKKQFHDESALYSYNDNNNQGRTFKKLCNSNSSIDIRSNKKLPISDCDNCIEMYKEMILRKEPFQPLQCLQCGKELNERAYQYYLRLFSTALNNHLQYFDGGRITPQWNNWLKMRSDQKKENLAYDIISGKSHLDQHNKNDVQLNKMISTKKAFLNRLNQKYHK